MKFYSIDEHTIIAANNQEEAEGLYYKDYDPEFEKIEELPFDAVVDFKPTPNDLGYIEIYLSNIVDKYRELPHVVNTENYDLNDFGEE